MIKSENNTVPDYIIRILRQRKGLGPDDKSLDDELTTLSASDKFYEVLSWKLSEEYGEEIRMWMEDCGITWKDDG